jgi:hypothetical protein
MKPRRSRLHAVPVRHITPLLQRARLRPGDARRNSRCRYVTHFAPAAAHSGASQVGYSNTPLRRE